MFKKQYQSVTENECSEIRKRIELFISILLLSVSFFLAVKLPPYALSPYMRFDKWKNQGTDTPFDDGKANNKGQTGTDMQAENHKPDSENHTTGSNIIITIDPGHGGFDPGKVSSDGLYEKDINLQISMYLAQILQERGYTVFLTRTTDQSLDSPGVSHRKSSDLNNRVNMAAENNSDLLVSIHGNSFSDTSVHGAQVFYYEGSEEGKQLASFIQTSIRENADTENSRDIKGNSQYLLLEKSTCTSVIVEYGFLSNPSEIARLSTSAYQEQMADAIATGIENYLNDAS